MVEDRFLPYKCTACHVSFPNGRKLIGHVKKCYHCCDCRLPFSNRLAYIRHVEEKHMQSSDTAGGHMSSSATAGGPMPSSATATGIRFACNFNGCPYSTVVRSRMVIHERKHSGERPFPCVSCAYAAKSKCALVRHKASCRAAVPV